MINTNAPNIPCLLVNIAHSDRNPPSLSFAFGRLYVGDVGRSFDAALRRPFGLRGGSILQGLRP